ncbi:MAG: homoserine dehydrogenase [Bifidobacteriaceae bacterium]|jgi:homoserine dehydrogenase|nr:homoserine dehydrogenase [Bifidobacteriaceae bacterium]
MSQPERQDAIGLSLLGCGTVGSEVVRLITTSAKDLRQRVGGSLYIQKVAVLSIAQQPDVPGLDRSVLTEDVMEAAAQGDIVVELLGGIEPARTAILAALARGASVVTANKALLASHGPELYEAAERAGADLYYEAAVGGAIPILRPIRESLAGDTVTRILGIVNGTTNYVLDRMTLEGLDFADVVRQAQALGYAEADPTADVEGYDAASKAAILASLAFHSRVALDDVYREGISAITAADVAAAAASGHVIKLLAIVERRRGVDGTDQGVIARVHPALVPLEHPLASVHGAFNAIYVEAEAAGELMFYGRGAGGRPTSSAVVGDVVTVARHQVFGGLGPGESSYLALPVLPVAEAETRYHIRLVVRDQPGVLAKVAQLFAGEGVSIETVRQTAIKPGQPGAATLANLAVVTHRAPEGALAAVVDKLAGLDVVDRVDGVLRVEGE